MKRRTWLLVFICLFLFVLIFLSSRSEVNPLEFPGGGISVLMWASPITDEACATIGSALINRYSVSLITTFHSEWAGFDKKFGKLHAYAHYCHTTSVAPHDLLMFVDAYDVLFVRPADQAYTKFKSLATKRGYDVVWNAEWNLWPFGSTWGKKIICKGWPNAQTEQQKISIYNVYDKFVGSFWQDRNHPFLNSGVAIGTREGLCRQNAAIMDMQRSGEYDQCNADQALTIIAAIADPKVTVDYDGELVRGDTLEDFTHNFLATVSTRKSSYSVEPDTLEIVYDKLYDMYPYVIHSAGHPHNMRNLLAKKLYTPEVLKRAANLEFEVDGVMKTYGSVCLTPERFKHHEHEET
eukprot:TRINITY_DN20282_c0_g1_i1.p1 TRINITY_DN20282_c0_g1~~TRINITY_DN20282_c0_g1_i1.p1  ORF type:complete len:351 (-),score=23.84 TRINITY_DN20282_c0_g1_i1:18-1070(-)